MARIVCVTSSLSGILHSTLELSRRLRTAGHEVIYAGFPDVRDRVGEHGFEYLELEPSGYESFLEEDRRQGLGARLASVETRRERAVESLRLDGFRRALDRLHPDLLLIDAELHDQIIVAGARPTRLALLNSFVSIWRRPGLPPPHRFAIPGVGWRGSRAGMSLLWLELSLRKRWRAMSHRVRRVGCDRLSVWRRLARREGFDLAREIDVSQWSIPFTYRRLPCLCLHAFELEFPHRPREGVHYVGPMVPTARDDARAAEAESSLSPIFARRREHPERRLVYAGFGSVFSADERLVRRLVRAVAGRPDWDMILSLAGHPRPETLGELPGNVHAFPWVDQPRVLSEADVAVTHGGTNTLDECVIHAVPVLVHIGGETDMAGTAARAVHHGLGIVGRRTDSSSTLRDHLDRLLVELRFRDNVQRLRSTYERYRTDRVAERVVDALIDERSWHDAR